MMKPGHAFAALAALLLLGNAQPWNIPPRTGPPTAEEVARLLDHPGPNRSFPLPLVNLLFTPPV